MTPPQRGKTPDSDAGKIGASGRQPRRSGILRLANATGRWLLKDGAALVRLDSRTLLHKARQQTGLTDFGDNSFLEALEVLLHSLETEAALNLIGRVCVSADFTRLLGSRLQVEADRQRYPEIAAESIRRPWFITGLPRSGTTFLHGLLAQDPAHRSPRVWELMYPSPPPEKASYASDRRIARTARQLKFLDILMPDFKKVHLIDARLPQECIAITSHDFRSYVFESMYTVPSYRRWHDALDKRPVYEYHRRFLQHLQWRCPGTGWVLKAPSHLLALESLLQVYPDAGIILTHRDPLKVLGSCTSFTAVLRDPFTDRLDQVSLAREVQTRWEDGARLAVAYRQRQPEEPGRSCDVRYNELVQEPMAVVRRIYRHFDREFTPAAEAAMQHFLADNPQGKGGVHRYSLEEFGLDPAAEKRRFQFYLDYFGIIPEGR